MISSSSRITIAIDEEKVINIGICVFVEQILYCCQTLRYSKLAEFIHDMQLIIQSYENSESPLEISIKPNKDIDISIVTNLLKEYNVQVEECQGFDIDDLDIILDAGTNLKPVIYDIFLEEKSLIGLFAVKMMLQKIISQDLDDQNELEKWITQVKIITLEKTVKISMQTMKSIGVFEDELHPNSFQESRVKEGLSLFNLLNNTRTIFGKARLSEWIRKPLFDIVGINDRLDIVEKFLENLETLTGIENLLKKLPNFRTSAIESNIIKDHKQWYKLQAFAKLTFQIESYLEKLNSNIAGFPGDKEQLMSISKTINDTIDFQLSKEQDRVVIKRGVDTHLDVLKQRYEDLPKILSKTAVSIARNVKKYFPATISVVYFPQLGYLSSVENIPGIRNDFEGVDEFGNTGEFEFVFESESSLFFKCSKTRNLDIEIGDIYGSIMDRELEINFQLHSELLQFMPLLNIVVDRISDLDCYVALANTARLRNFSRPLIVPDPELHLIKARHPLQEVQIENFVPNTIHLSKTDTVIMLTGPNSSGKTIVLKQVALIVLMAHIGSFIPCDPGSIIGLTDMICTKLYNRESVSNHMSSFALDCHQVSSILTNCSTQSLVLIDEFGKGTLANDGIGLLVGVINNLQSEKRPRSIIVSNFKSALNYVKIPIYHMKVYNDDTEGVAFLYYIAKGSVDESWATICALKAGLNEGLIKRANHFTKRYLTGENLTKLFEVFSLDDMIQLDSFANNLLTKSSHDLMKMLS